MAKKKKTKKVEQSNPVVYNGNVTVTLKKGSTVISRKTTHNAGTELLFRALCMCLCRDSAGLSSMPYFIDAGTISDGTYVTLLNSPSVITRRTTIYDTNGDPKTWKAQFVTTIVYSQLTSAATPINSLVLQDTENQVLARVDLSQEDQIIIESNSYNAMIEWEMSFVDASTAQEGI